MLLACDESKGYGINVVGAISVPISKFYQFESESTRLRIEHGVLGELKWCKLKDEGKYFEFYIKLLKLVFSFPDVRFHSNSYTGHQYKASYTLMRSITWKLSRVRMFNDLYLLFDSNESLGRTQLRITRRNWTQDRAIRHKFNICEQVDSKIFNVMQIADLLTGAMAYKINYSRIRRRSGTNKAKDLFISRIESEIDHGEQMELSTGALWNYDSPKVIQHFNLHAK